MMILFPVTLNDPSYPKTAPVCSLKFPKLRYFGTYSMYQLRYFCVWIGKRMWLIISTVLSKLKNFSRSEAVTYNENVVISRKRCKIETLLLQITDSKWYVGVAYRIMAIRWHWVTIKVIHLIEAFLMRIFFSFCGNWQDFNWCSASRGLLR